MTKTNEYGLSIARLAAIDLATVFLCCIRSLIKSGEIQGQEYIVGKATFRGGWFLC